jgi:endonuclease G
MVRSAYVLSYNRSKNIPNWVSWQLNQSWLGDLPRRAFEPDPSLPKDWYRVVPEDYTGSGFDRGHLVPAADRNRTEANNRTTFLMTNIVPQAPDSNRGPWEELERYCRELARQGKELYILTGGAGQGGIGKYGRKTAIARSQITVPAMLWKVIVVLDKPASGIKDITDATRTIAVIMPNQQGIKDRNWQLFRTSIDDVEQLTGFNFLNQVPEAIQNAIESKVDNL